MTDSPLMIGLDFGSSTTKVALRHEWNRIARLLERHDLTGNEDVPFCSPSAVVRHYKPPGWSFGETAGNIAPCDAAKVYENWKTLIFAPPPRSASRVTVAAASSADGPAVTDSPPAQPLHDGTGFDEDYRLDVREVAGKYFRWLRQQVERACAQQKVAFADAQTRVCVPHFTAIAADVSGLTDDQQIFVELLQECGWRLAERYPLVSEPVANVIGIVTGGRMSTWRPPSANGARRVRLGDMIFKDHPIFQAIRRKNSPARALAVDVGAFTTDFALLRFDADEGGVYPEVTALSKPVGVKNLDRSVGEALPAEYAEPLRTWELRRRFALRQAIYSGKPHARFGRTYGHAQLKVVAGCIEAFADDIVSHAREFLAGHGNPDPDVLVLTGGGHNLPAVRDRMVRQFGPYVQVVHAPASETQITSHFHPLGPQLTRGGSALGAVSVYFDLL